MRSELLQRVMRATLATQRDNWEHGTVAQAFLEAGEPDTAILMAVEAVNRQTPDGRCSQVRPVDACTDPCSIGEVLIFACEQTADPFLINGRDRLFEWSLHLAPRSSEGIVYHLGDSKQFWVDSIYMMPPFLARGGCYDEAVKQLDGWWAALYDEQEGLLSHMWDDDKKRFIRRDFWGVGNGWAAAGLARMISLLPPSRTADRERLTARATRLLNAAVRWQREDGLFHNVLNDAGSFPEVNCAQMFAYTIFRGVREGWLDDALIPAAERMREAAHRAVDHYGFVRNVCGVPSFDTPSYAPEGQAFFILMESMYERLR